MPAIVRSDLGVLLEAGLKADFLLTYRRAQDSLVYTRIASVIQTTLPTQKYGWLGSVPTMREWIDERLPRGLKKYEYAISDKTWEATVAVERKALEDDQLSAIRLRVRELGNEAARHKDQIVVQQLLAGFSTFGPDGQYFFDNDHGESGTVQSNMTTAPLSASALQDAIANMMAFTDDQGVPLGVMPNLLVVGPRLRWRAMELLESTVIPVRVGEGNAGTGATSATSYRNVLQGALDLIVTPYITGYQWFVLDTTREIRAIILQERSDVPVEFAALDNPNANESVFMRDMLYYGVRARYGVGYGLWQLAYGSNATS